MGKKNVAVNKYLSDYGRFADAFNYFAFGGEKVILPKNLTRKDPAEMSLFKTGSGFDSKEKMRDLKERCVVMDSGEAVLITLGIEGQEHIHYAMPPKNMIYDAVDYDSQVRKIAKEHKKNKDLTGDEFLSGFSKEDKLVPVITLVIYFGSKEWDGPLSLLEMFDVKDERILKYVNDYRINIIEPGKIDDISGFETDLGLILEFFKHAENKAQMKQYLENNREALSELDEDAVNLLSVCGNVNIEKPELDEGGNVNMCKAIDDMIQDAVEEAKEEKEKEMCKAIDGMIQDAVEEAKEEKEKEMKEYGLKVLILDNLEEGKTREIIISKIIKNFSLPENEANEYFTRYAGNMAG